MAPVPTPPHEPRRRPQTPPITSPLSRAQEQALLEHAQFEERVDKGHITPQRIRLFADILLRQSRSNNTPKVEKRWVEEMLRRHKEATAPENNKADAMPGGAKESAIEVEEDREETPTPEGKRQMRERNTKTRAQRKNSVEEDTLMDSEIMQVWSRNRKTVLKRLRRSEYRERMLKEGRRLEKQAKKQAERRRKVGAA